MPQIIFKINNPSFNTLAKISSREISHVEIFSLKLAHLLLPVSNHRIPLFSKLTEFYNTNFPLINENAKASLGLLLAIGFVIGSLSVFFNIFKKKKDEIITEMGKINLFFL